MKKQRKQLHKCWLILTAFSLLFLNALFFTALKTDAATLSTPTGLVQTESTKSIVTLEWKAILNADRYQFQISDDNQNWILLEGVYSSSPEQTLYNLSTGSSYFVRVRAIKFSYAEGVLDAGEWSKGLHVVTSTNPIASGKQIDASTSSVTVSWSPVAGATHYDIYYSTAYDQYKKVGQTTKTSMKIANSIKEGSSYYVRILPIKKSTSGYEAKGRYSYEYYTISNVKSLPGKVKALRELTWYENISSLHVGWNKIDSADGYQISFYNSKKKLVKTLTDRSDHVYYSSTPKNTCLYAKIRAYTTINGKKKYGAWSGYTYFVPQPKVDAEKGGKGTLKLSWSKIAGATRYHVYMSTSKGGGYKKIGTLPSNKSTFTVSKFKSSKISFKKKYYFYVMAEKKVDSKTYKCIKDTIWNTSYL